MSLENASNRKITATALGFALALLPFSVSAATTEKVTFDQLDEEVKVLLRKLESANEDAAAYTLANPVVITAGEKGFILGSVDKQFEFKLRGLVQADGRYFDEGIKGQNTGVKTTTFDADNNFVLRRARPIIEGTFFGKYGFRITPDFAGSAVTIADAYVDANLFSQFKIRAGKFTPAIGLERLQSSAETKFIETSLVSNFIPARDVGLQFNGDVINNTLNYSVAYVNGANDGATPGNSDVDNDKEIQARLFYAPFGIFQGLGFGIAATTNDTRGESLRTTLSKYKTVGQEDFFGYRSDKNIAAATNPATTASIDTVYGDGRRTRLVPQIHYFKSNFGVFAEFLKEKQDLTRYKSAGVVIDPKNRSAEIESDAWNLTASWTITGEEQSLKGIKPFKNFDLATGGAGAWELVIRLSELSVEKDAFKGKNGVLGDTYSFAEATKSAQRAQNVGVGVNWYLNKVIKVSANYDDTSFNWGGGGTALHPEDRDDEHVLSGRFQASF